LRPASELRKDRVAAVVIRTGGVSVILIVLAMILVIAGQALPLFGPTAVGELHRVAADRAWVVGSGTRPSTVWWLDRDGVLEAAVSGSEQRVADLADRARVLDADAEIGGVVSVLLDDGRALVGRVLALHQNRGPSSVESIEWRQSAVLPEVAEDADQPRGITAVADDDRILAARWDRAGIELHEFSGGRPVGTGRRIVLPDPVAVALSARGDHVAVASGSGELTILDWVDLEPAEVAELGDRVASLRFLEGGRSLVAAGRDRSLTVMMATPVAAVVNRSGRTLAASGSEIADGARVVLPATAEVTGLAAIKGVEIRRTDPIWRPIHELPPTRAQVTAISAGRGSRSFVVGDADGRVSVYNATSARLLDRTKWIDGAVEAVGFAPRGNGLVAAGSSGVHRRDLRSAHPEISLSTLFLPVWYEGFAEPRSMWQTSGGSDEFQPKFGLGPLIVGTLKATVYSMLVSVPLALLAALYVSQLAPRWLQVVVKPTVEMMAAVPTVVVGFLAALWLAPRLQLWLFPTLLVVLALPFGAVAARMLWLALPAALRRRFPPGVELVMVVAGGGAVVAVVVAASGPLELWFFDGDFQQTLFDLFGIRYEQRNALIVGIALGFAVIPVIFTIAEDACSGVSSSLVQAARALGATRWQAAVRLVVPAARPGLFAAVMLGLGRAVGETMIVLMAAGNTPILDLLPFNGMRTMSAAMAFEIPEAAVGGTLFRVLFLTGFLLFVFSLIFTTAADVVSRRFRRQDA
jgi:ABC-type uncharacterized transport system permease subunit